MLQSKSDKMLDKKYKTQVLKIKNTITKEPYTNKQLLKLAQQELAEANGKLELAKAT